MGVGWGGGGETLVLALDPALWSFVPNKLSLSLPSTGISLVKVTFLHMGIHELLRTVREDETHLANVRGDFFKDFETVEEAKEV